MGKLSRTGIGAQRNNLKITPDLFQTLKDLTSSMIDENFHEVPCPKPEEIVVSKRPPSLKEQIQRLVKTELSEQMRLQDMETFEEANDFDIEDEDALPMSEYVIHDMVPEEPVPNEKPVPKEKPKNEAEQKPENKEESEKDEK